MSWVTFIWAMVASACMTLAVLHLLVWYRQKASWGYLLFALLAATNAGVACCELWAMHAATPADFGTAVRWLHVPILVVVVAVVGFVRLHLRAGRPWLAWTTCGVRVLSLVLNFLTGENLNFVEHRLVSVRFLGESVSVADGVRNPWMLVGELSLVLLVVFVVDAAVAIWRRGNRRQALVMGGSFAFFVFRRLHR